MKILLQTGIAPAIALCFISMIGFAASCGKTDNNKVQVRSAQPMKSIDEVIRVSSDSLMAIPGVVGLYHGLDEGGKSCLKVMVKQKTAELEKRIPKEIEGYPVVIDETGEIKPMK